MSEAMLKRTLQIGKGQFWKAGVTSILARSGHQLDPSLKASLRDILASAIKDESRQRFGAYNDNFPAMSALATLVGGPLAGLEPFMEEGLNNLRSVRASLRRRGRLSEYCTRVSAIKSNAHRSSC